MNPFGSTRSQHVLGGLLAPVFVIMAGCYSYSPVERTTVRPGMEVQARVTDAAAQAAVEDGPVVVSGEVVASSDDDLTLSVWRADLRAAHRFDPHRQRVELPWSRIAGLRTKRLSHLKTGAVIGAVVTGAIFITQRLFSEIGGAGGSPGDPGDPT